MAAYCAGGRRHLPQPAYLNCYWFPVVWAFEAHAAHKHPNGEPCPLLRQCADYTIADDDTNLKQMKSFLDRMSPFPGVLRLPRIDLRPEHLPFANYFGMSPAELGFGNLSAPQLIGPALQGHDRHNRPFIAQWNMICFWAADSRGYPNCGAHAFVVSDVEQGHFAELSSNHGESSVLALFSDA